MKKKFLILFLICCMMFFIASPVFAADLPDPDSSWDKYIIVHAQHPDFPDSDFFAIQVKTASSDLSNYRFNFLFNDLNEIIGIYLTRTTNDNAQQLNYFVYSYIDGSWVKERSGTHGVSTLDSRASIGAFGSSTPLSSALSAYDVNSSSPVYVMNYVFNSDTGKYEVIYTDSVFPLAPPDPMVTLAEQMMEKTPEALDLDGKLKILVPFGISCLALLISLPLLLKVLRRFLG